MKTLAPVRHCAAHAHGVDLLLEDGGSFQLEVLEHSMVRVRHKPATGYREPRTWAIAPQAGVDVPWHGRPRDDASGFSRPPAQLTQGAGVVTLRTGALCVSLRTEPLGISWQTADGRFICSDRATSSYLSSPHRRCAPLPAARPCGTLLRPG